MKRSGAADIPLHGGHVPQWLAKRMQLLGGAIVQAIVLDYGKSEVLKRLSDPLWFQSFGAVLGMDWHSSGITTSVMGALKKSLNPIAKELGIYVCGGRGKHSRKTPEELLEVACKIGLNGQKLVRASKLSAKVDNTAIQDGYQLYLHNFIVTDEGEWAVVQQGMNNSNGYARRYHWHSDHLQSFVETPHSGICGISQGDILNLTATEAAPTRQSTLTLTQENDTRLLAEVRKLTMPRHHDVRAKDVNLKRLGAVLALAQHREVMDFESLLLLKGLGPRTLQSLVLVSEVIYGTPSRFEDPARFSFAHGGKDGHPFPVPTKVYDEIINFLKGAVNKAHIGHADKRKAMQKLDAKAKAIEQTFHPNTNYKQLVQRERANSYKYGGRTVMGWAKPPQKLPNGQLRLF